MATILLPPDFKEFLRLLNSSKAEYLLIGGYAVNYYGYPRATADLDVWVGVDPDNSEKVAAALHAFGFADGVPVNLIGIEDLKATTRGRAVETRT